LHSKGLPNQNYKKNLELKNVWMSFFRIRQEEYSLKAGYMLASGWHALLMHARDIAPMIAVQAAGWQSVTVFISIHNVAILHRRKS